MTRPRSIILFERVAWAAFGLGIMSVYFQWDPQIEHMRSAYPVASFCISQLLYFGSYALLIWLISRRGNAVARGIFATLVLIVAFLFLAILPPVSDMSVETSLGIAQSLLTLASLGLIFRRDTVPWFQGWRPIDPEIFR